MRAQAEVDEDEEAGKEKKEAAGQAVRPSVYLCLCKSHYWSTRRIESRSTQQVPVCRCIIYVGRSRHARAYCTFNQTPFLFFFVGEIASFQTTTSPVAQELDELREGIEALHMSAETSVGEGDPMRERIFGGAACEETGERFGQGSDGEEDSEDAQGAATDSEYVNSRA